MLVSWLVRLVKGREEYSSTRPRFGSRFVGSVQLCLRVASELLMMLLLLVLLLVFWMVVVTVRDGQMVSCGGGASGSGVGV